MKDLYSVLDVCTYARPASIDAAYEYKKNHQDIGNSDYDNMSLFVEAKRAYNVLSNKALRFLYDIKTEVQERCVISFDSQKDIDLFMATIESKLVKMHQQKVLHISNIHLFRQELRDLNLKNINVENGLTSAIKKIENKTNKIAELKTKTSELSASINQKNKEISTINEEMNELNKYISYLENRNERYFKLLRRTGINVFKIVSVVVGIFLFIITMLIIGL